MSTSLEMSHVLVETRKSARRHKQTKFYIASQDPQLDIDLKTAIKRSKLERVHIKADLESLPTVPVIRPTDEEFRDPIQFWNKYTHLGQCYGAIKVIPPSSYKSKVPIDFNTYKFKVRQQNIKLLSSGKGYKHPPELWTCDELIRANKKIKEQFEKENVDFDKICDVEKLFWDLVEGGNRDVIVYYGADLPSKLTECEEYAKHPWNLNNLPKVQGSLLAYMKHTVPGVNSPWLYLGMCLSSFSWHTEDNYFGAINYHHTGAPKIWYIVPPSRAHSLEKLLVGYTSTENREFALYSLRVQLSPNLLLSNNIPVYRIVQEANEFILLWPRTFHAGFNIGFNCNEACNIAPVTWIPMGHKSFLKYRYSRRSCVPYFNLIFSAASSLYDFTIKDLEEIGNVLKILLIQEYQSRSAFKMPRLSMDIDYKLLDCCDEIKSLLSNASIDSGESTFTDVINNLKQIEDLPAFLEACKFASQICTKDCSICESPLFISSVSCCHNDMILCGSCSQFSTCKCSEKIMLYRVPLIAIYTLLKIIDEYTLGQFNLIQSVPPIQKLNILDKTIKCKNNQLDSTNFLLLESAVSAVSINGRSKSEDFLAVCPYVVGERQLPTLLTCKYLIAAVYEERDEYNAHMS